jgi:hypothetical protein
MNILIVCWLHMHQEKESFAVARSVEASEMHFHACSFIENWTQENCLAFRTESGDKEPLMTEEWQCYGTREGINDWKTRWSIFRLFFHICFKKWKSVCETTMLSVCVCVCPQSTVGWLDQSSWKWLCIFMTPELKSKSASLSWCQAPIWDPRPIFLLLSSIIFRQLRVSCEAPSLTRSRVCSFQFLLGIASAARDSWAYFIVSIFETIPTWRASFLCLFPPGTG